MEPRAVDGQHEHGAPLSPGGLEDGRVVQAERLLDVGKRQGEVDEAPLGAVLEKVDVAERIITANAEHDDIAWPLRAAHLVGGDIGADRTVDGAKVDRPAVKDTRRWPFNDRPTCSTWAPLSRTLSPQSSTVLVEPALRRSLSVGVNVECTVHDLPGDQVLVRNQILAPVAGDNRDIAGTELRGLARGPNVRQSSQCRLTGATDTAAKDMVGMTSNP